MNLRIHLFFCDETESTFLTLQVHGIDATICLTADTVNRQILNLFLSDYLKCKQRYSVSLRLHTASLVIFVSFVTLTHI